MPTYRITWCHEVFIEADNPKDMQEKWEQLDLGQLNQEAKENKIVNHDYVEKISVENENREEVRGIRW